LICWSLLRFPGERGGGELILNIKTKTFSIGSFTSVPILKLSGLWTFLEIISANKEDLNFIYAEKKS